MILFHRPGESLRRRIEHLENGAAFAALVDRAEAGIDLPDGRRVVTAGGEPGTWSLAGPGDWRARLAGFLHRTGSYLAASEGSPPQVDELLEELRRELSNAATLSTTLVPLSRVAFGRATLECGSFEIRKFSPDEVSALLRRGGFIEACLQRHSVECERLSAYWYLCRAVSDGPVLTETQRPDRQALEGGFYFRGVPQSPVPCTSWDGVQLEPLALWPWEEQTVLTNVEAYDPDPTVFEVPFVLRVSHSLLDGKLTTLPTLSEETCKNLRKLDTWRGGSADDPGAAVQPERYESYEGYVEHFSWEGADPDPPENLDQWMERKALQCSGWQEVQPFSEGFVLTAKETDELANLMSHADRTLSALRSHKLQRKFQYLDRALEHLQRAMTEGWPWRFLSHVWAMEALLEGEGEGPAAPRSHRGGSILESSWAGQAPAGGNFATELEAIWRVRSAIVHPKKPVGSEATKQALSDKARSYSRCMLHWFLRLYSVDGLTSGRSAWLPAHRDVLKLLDGDATTTSPSHAMFVSSLHARFPGFPRLDA